MQTGKSEKYDEPPRWFAYDPGYETEAEAVEYRPMYLSMKTNFKWEEKQWRNKDIAADVAEWYAEYVWDNSACEAFNYGRDQYADIVVIDAIEKKAVTVCISLEHILEFQYYGGNLTEKDIDWKKFEERER